MPAPLPPASSRMAGGSRAAGLLGGMLADAVLADPPAGHPVAAFGRLAASVEARCHADSRARGTAYALALVALPALVGAAGERLASRPLPRAGTTAALTWAVVGGTTLAREATAVGRSLEAGDLAGARARLPALCGRDPAGLDEKELARATVESVAENTSDAVVAPLLWGALAGLPGLAGYRAVNTLDAMVGHRSTRYVRFGWAAARLDDLANLLPARLTGVLAAGLAPLVGGSPVRAGAVLLRYGARHPSPNAGRCEAAFAGALGVRLGGTNRYGTRVEHRPTLGEGRSVEVGDIARAVRLSRAVGVVAALLAAGLAAVPPRPRRRRGRR